MESLTKKQKIIAGAIISIVVAIIGIYGYHILQKESWEQNIILGGENLQNEMINSEEENITTESKEEVNKESTLAESETEQYKDLEGKIVIHITGAVQKTGILVLPTGARIADAIEASRRNYGKG